MSITRRIPAIQLDLREHHQQKLKCNPDRQVVADRVSMALCQEADARPNHEIFKGHNVARTPLSTAGQKRSIKNSL